MNGGWNGNFTAEIFLVFVLGLVISKYRITRGRERGYSFAWVFFTLRSDGDAGIASLAGCLLLDTFSGDTCTSFSSNFMNCKQEFMRTW
jgi:hypothetical protein